MSTATSPDPQTYHEAELDALISDLVEAGFLPRQGDRHQWVGPIRPSLARLTSATEMRIEIRDGWPYLHPYIYAAGLVGRKHVNALGNVCLWPEGDDGYADWLRLEPILRRIDAWVGDQEAGVTEPAMDAHLYVGVGGDRMLTVDIEGLISARLVRPSGGESGLLRAGLANGVFSVGLRGNLAAAWFWHPELKAPPAEPSRLPSLLTAGQRRNFDVVTHQVQKSRPGVVLLLWDDAGHLNAFGAEVRRSSPGSFTLVALEVARTDRTVLRLRSGPDAPALATKTVTIFGVGAIGSEVAMLLARSGIGRLILIDQEHLRPANLSRHAASARTVGMPKARAMAQTIGEALPDVRVHPINSLVWRPALIKPLVTSADVVVDATGNRAYRDLLSRISAEASVPLIAAALHRGGRIARVRVQATGAHPIWARSEATGFPEVLAEAGTPPASIWETGCGAPINNAPPVAVAAAATLASRIALGVLAGRDARDRDVIEVYEPSDIASFAEAGIRTFEPTA